MCAGVHEEMAVAEGCCFDCAVISVLYEHESKGGECIGWDFLNSGVKLCGQLAAEGEGLFHKGGRIVFRKGREFICMGCELEGDKTRKELAVA